MHSLSTDRVDSQSRSGSQHRHDPPNRIACQTQDDPTDALQLDDRSLGVAELDAFSQQGLITSVHAKLTSGKEATVYCCRAHPSTRAKYLAAKVYREHAAKNYRRSGPYFEGRERLMKTRTVRAVTRGSTFGHNAMAAMWIWAEYDGLKRLSAAGADVPKPLAMTERTILMEYVGNGAGPAPHLHGVELDRNRAEALFERILNNVEILLTQNLVHGDLSPYNILVWKDRPWIIDLPQAVDPRFNPNAFDLLRRDLKNVCAFFADHGVATGPDDLALGLWDRYRRAKL